MEFTNYMMSKEALDLCDLVYHQQKRKNNLDYNLKLELAIIQRAKDKLKKRLDQLPHSLYGGALGINGGWED